MKDQFEMQCEVLQPWSTFVMKTQLPLLILEKMLEITDEIVEKRTKISMIDVGAGQIEDMFVIDFEILEREKLIEFFLVVCRDYVIQALCQSDPFNKEKILKEEWMTRLTGMHISSQKDNEYFPIHQHLDCHLSSVMYLKIPEFLPSRKHYGNEEDGSINFTNNTSQDIIFSVASLQIIPQVGDFFIFPATLQHQVYPFRTADGKGERRSVSFNASFTSKAEQDALKKQQEEQEAI